MQIDIQKEAFVNRHIGPSESERSEMLEAINAKDMEELINQTIPKSIQIDDDMNLFDAVSEDQLEKVYRDMASRNKVYKSFIGMGYYDTIVPNVIKRNVLENPGWYTAYTPYQAEIAQGRLEALINFQTMVCDLTAMDMANASLLDEGTAAAEAIAMAHASRKGAKKKKADKVLVADHLHPQTLDVMLSRTEPQAIEIKTQNVEEFDLSDPEVYAIVVQYPTTGGRLIDYTELFKEAKDNDIQIIVAADLLALTMVKPPGEMGADVVVGSTQRFGVPMGYGGPHAAFFAARDRYKRRIPGRIIGVSKDTEGNPAYRMALQTREQHIRREKATSNICTAQVLLAVMAGLYGVYHGPEGLRKIAKRVNNLTRLTYKALGKLGYSIQNEDFFDTLTIQLDSEKEKKQILEEALNQGINLRAYPEGVNSVGISIDETKELDDVQQIVNIFAKVAASTNGDIPKLEEYLNMDIEASWPDKLTRTSSYMEHPTFKSYQTEHEMLRYLKRLENRDLSLVHSMITLGSCTMKLNATAEMIPLTWPEFASIHPFAPADQAKGYKQLFEELEHQLREITGFYDVSLQPNSGAQGEYTGLMTIRAYHHSRGESNRNITIVPSSAHGTNPASATMAGMKVVVVDCDDHGNIDVEDLRAKADKYSDNLAALMVTYPSTHGVFEEDIQEICEIIHSHGGQVYLDGANMNAQVGLTSPAAIGSDVCHLNLHKTFCIPHGGGGPGVGPIGVAKHLAPFLPGHRFAETGGDQAIPSVSSAPWGSASILTISYGYMRLMGDEGLTEASRVAILNSNYLKEKLSKHYPILYTGKNNRTGHEFIIDLRPYRKTASVDAGDVAKRLIDYSFHAPTLSFPVPGTMMIEPTESESRAELDRFCEAMISIRKEIEEIENGEADPENNVLKNAPHTQRTIIAGEWDRPYSQEKAVFPLSWLQFGKFWPSVSRVDDAYGDRNLMCSCVPVEEYAEGQEPEAVE